MKALLFLKKIRDFFILVALNRKKPEMHIGKKQVRG